MEIAPNALIDALDAAVIRSLQRDPRAPSKQLAEEHGVSEATIAHRIRSLQDKKLVRVVAQEDIRALGFDLLVLVDVFVRGRPAEDVAAELAQFDEVGAVSVTLSSPELIVQVNARDRADLVRILDERFADIDGVVAIESEVILEILKFNAVTGDLAAE